MNSSFNLALADIENVRMMVHAYLPLYDNLRVENTGEIIKLETNDPVSNS
jgi:hypothetical protein